MGVHDGPVRSYAGRVDSAHDRFESLAVGHALGGLDASDEADFRTHLQRCGACRRRVAELRSIADDLAAAERDERQRSRVRTTSPPRAEVEGPAGLPAVPLRTMGVLVLVVLVVLGALGFWNLHLRTQVTTAVGAGDRLELALRTFAEGRALEAELTGTVRGQLASDGERVAFALAGLPSVADGEVLIVWRLGTEDGDEAVLVARTDDGVLTGSVTVEDATALLVTLEPIGSHDGGPGDRELARAALRPAG